MGVGPLIKGNEKKKRNGIEVIERWIEMRGYCNLRKEMSS